MSARRTDGPGGPGPLPAHGAGAPAVLSIPAQDCLKAVYTLGEWARSDGTAAVTTSALSQRLGVSVSTASEMVRKLTSAGLLAHERYGAVTLTDVGRRAALGVVRRHRVIETYLVAALDYTWDEVHAEAEAMEHAVSETLVDRMDAWLGRPAHDPHGDPIPTSDGRVELPDAVRLSALPVGAEGTVARISDADPDLLRSFSEHGLVLRAAVHVLGPRPMGAGTAVRIGRAEAAPDDERVVLDLGEAATAAVWVVLD